MLALRPVCISRALTKKPTTATTVVNVSSLRTPTLSFWSKFMILNRKSLATKPKSAFLKVESPMSHMSARQSLPAQQQITKLLGQPCNKRTTLKLPPQTTGPMMATTWTRLSSKKDSRPNSASDMTLNVSTPSTRTESTPTPSLSQNEECEVNCLISAIFY